MTREKVATLKAFQNTYVNPRGGESLVITHVQIQQS